MEENYKQAIILLKESIEILQEYENSNWKVNGNSPTKGEKVMSDIYEFLSKIKENE